MMLQRIGNKSVQFLRRSNLWKVSQCALSDTVREREKMYYDVVTVGAGPAGLSAAIRLKQLAQEKGVDISVCVVEKGAEVGAHILSGNVFEPQALNELIPNWKELEAPLQTRPTDDAFYYLTENSSFKIPHFLLPKQLHNEGNYIISLSQLVRWLGARAEELGVEIFPGFAADEVLYKADGSVSGVSNLYYISLYFLIVRNNEIPDCNKRCRYW